MLRSKISQPSPFHKKKIIKNAQFVQQEESTSRPYVYSDFQQKMPLKSLAKSSERTGPGSPKAARGSGSSWRAAQLKWDWDSSKGVPRNTRNEEQICPSQAPNGAAKNQKTWKVTIHEQKASTPGNPEWRTIKGNGWENLQPSRNGFCSLGKNDNKEDSKKAKPKR